MFPVNRCGLHYSGEGKYFPWFYLMSIGFLGGFYFWGSSKKSSIGVTPGLRSLRLPEPFVHELSTWCLQKRWSALDVQTCTLVRLEFSCFHEDGELTQAEASGISQDFDLVCDWARIMLRGIQAWWLLHQSLETLIQWSVQITVENHRLWWWLFCLRGETVFSCVACLSWSPGLPGSVTFKFDWFLSVLKNKGNVICF